MQGLKCNISESCSPELVNKLAKEHKFTQRESKLKPEEFVDLMMFQSFDHKLLSLQSSCRELMEQHEKSISKVALHKRYNGDSVNFLKALLSDQISNRMGLETLSLFKDFDRIVINDSSKYSISENHSGEYPSFGGCRPSSALMNIQFSFDMKNGGWQFMDLTKATQNDQGYTKNTFEHIQAKDLLIRDLGYITLEYLKETTRREAFFLNRYQLKWNAFTNEEGNFIPINWEKTYRKITKHKLEFLELNAHVGENDKLPCRMIVSLVPEQAYQQRIRKIEKQARSKGHNVSDDYRIQCRFNIFITNVPEAMLAAKAIEKIYGIRWQIELIFKVWKSLVKIDENKKVKTHRLECQLLGKFIWILLNWKIFRSLYEFILEQTPNHCLSVWKFFSWAMSVHKTFRTVLLKRVSLEDWFKKYIYQIIQTLLIEPKKGKTPHYQILMENLNP